jgi:hypothetical protein
MGSKWETIREAVASSISILQALKKMELDPRGSNYRTFYKVVKANNIDISHFKGKAHGTSGRKQTISCNDILVKNGCEIGSKRKSRMIKDGLLKNLCYECNINEWRGKPIVLQLDHINGDHFDNRIENLRLICPNCHSQTNTYCGKNHKTNIKKSPKYYCKCGGSKSKTSNMCLLCENKRKSNNTKINWPPLEDLKTMIANSNYTQVAKMLGVSDNTIRKHIRTHQTKVSN